MDRYQARRTIPMYNFYTHTHKPRESNFYRVHYTYTLLMGRLIEEGGYDEKRLILYYYIGHGAK